MFHARLHVARPDHADGVPVIGAAAALPEPSAEARAHSDRLGEAIAAEIVAAGGAIPFSRYMELCLYAPGLGYYSAGATKFGAAGDFVTAPELGPLFAECVAEAIAPVLASQGADSILLELGGGSGAFACDALTRLAELGALPGRYLVLEPSATLRERQRERVAALPGAIAGRVQWIQRPPEQPWRGVLFANEVLDALPTPRFLKHRGGIYEEAVALADAGGFVTAYYPADALLRGAVRNLERTLGRAFAEGYRSELLPQLPYWLRAVSDAMERGLALFVDYGYPRAEYYLAERDQGTLICHYRHRAHTDPFFLPGLQDVTAFVDFTALAESGTAAGLELAGYCSQSAFLLANGLPGRLEHAQGLDPIERHRRTQEAKRLTLPGEMGERFQVMGFTRRVEAPLPFGAGDLRYRL
ncbi:MAG TPA: SAM-dependent methyltransferase [Xanthomonadaceae bacterium]|nr:SAM-dependent methyltransferase [Xanthomonadaceae bacterium]